MSPPLSDAEHVAFLLYLPGCPGRTQSTAALEEIRSDVKGDGGKKEGEIQTLAVSGISVNPIGMPGRANAFLFVCHSTFRTQRQRALQPKQQPTLVRRSRKPIESGFAPPGLEERLRPERRPWRNLEPPAVRRSANSPTVAGLLDPVVAPGSYARKHEEHRRWRFPLPMVRYYFGKLRSEGVAQ